MIYCILGMSGVGKSTIAKKISMRLNMPIIVSYTSRPKRPGEIEGIDYHYVDNKYFDDNLDDFIEKRDYTVYNGLVWKYGYKKSSFNNKNTDYLVVIDPSGYQAFKQYFGKSQICPILIQAPYGILYERAKKRGDNLKEIERRLADDFNKFENFMKEENYETVYNFTDLETAIKTTENIILNNKESKQNG